MAGKRSRQEVLDAFAVEGFRIGPHKAFQLARDTERARLVVCSELSHELADRLLLDSVADVQSAVDAALGKGAPTEAVAVLPHASSTIPFLDGAL
jgi:nickel-dependent lactate racemase